MSSPARGSGEFRSAGRKEHPRRNRGAGLAGVAVGGLGQDPLTVIQSRRGIGWSAIGKWCNADPPGRGSRRLHSINLR